MYNINQMYDGSYFAITNIGNTLYMVIAYGTNQFQLDTGTLNSNGTVTWANTGGNVWINNWPGANNDIKNSSDSTCYSVAMPSIYVNQSGYIYLSFMQESTDSKWHIVVYRCDTAGNNNAKIYNVNVSNCAYNSQLLGQSNTIVLLYGTGICLDGAQPQGSIGGPITAVYSTNNGGTWSSVATADNYNITNSQAVIIGNVTYEAASNSSGIYLLKFNVTSGSWGSSRLLDNSSNFAGISTDGVNTLYVFYCNSTTMSYIISSDLGNTWTAPMIFSSSETNAAWLTMAPAVFGNYVLGEWTSGTSPYSVRAAVIPVTVPNAATSKNTWSKPGLSPYEDYFTHESEYVSPGNGLLGIEQTDFSLSGRGLDLDITRVFSTPYAFIGTTPYLYDNYTATNIGLGWSLSFPWFGQNYFHLWDGQVYTYNWSGNVFLNTNGECFKLVNNNGSSYDLYSVSGTDYHFDSSKLLVNITDSSGNNAISFSYNNLNQISQITDTVGRNVTFVYNANNQLATIVTGEGNWTYSYSGSNLVSVTDPLNRTVSYVYNTGINNWLISEVIYPTGGLTSYTYGTNSTGTEALTYFVTLQNINASIASLSRSTSFNYSLLNGQVQWCNATVSDGFSIKGYTLYDFANPLAEIEIAEDQNGNIILSHQNYFDLAGRIVLTSICSPSNVLLAYSIFTYDNWSNVISSVDYDGHQSWFSYSNTNTSNSFPGASGFTNGFYSQTINSNIHNLLLGQAQFQNGSGSNNIESYSLYDANGHLLQQKQLHNGGWLLSNWTYDAYGNVLTSTDSLNRTTYYQYSPSYNSAYLTQQSVMVGSQNVTSSYTYNFTKGVKLTSTDLIGNTTTYAYDKIGRLISVTFPSVGGVVASKSYVYNDTGNYIILTDENGNSIKDVFDGLDRLVQVVSYNGSAVYSTENYTYNWLDEVSTHTLASGSSYSYIYDSLGKLISTINPDGTTANASYDYVSNIQNAIDENACNYTRYNPPDTWWNANFTYRIPVTVGGSSSGDVVGYQFKITIINGTGTNSGNTVYLNNMTRADFNDIRFVYKNGSGIYNYWAQSVYPGKNATFWFKIDDKIVSNTSFVFYIYCGNPSASSLSNGSNTFPFFDNFTGTSINSALWSTHTSTYVTLSQNNSLKMSLKSNSYGVTGGIRSKSTFGPGCAVIFNGSVCRSGGETIQAPSGFVNSTVWDGNDSQSTYAPNIFAYATSTTSVDYAKTKGSGTGYGLNVTAYYPLDNSTHIIELDWQTTNVTFLIDGVNRNSTTAAGNIASGNASVGMDGYAYTPSGTSTLMMYWIAVRNYTLPEPTITSVGSVQSQASLITPSTSYGYDWMGRLLWVRQYYSSTSYCQTNYTYDQLGNLLSVTDANGNRTTYKYDDLNRVITTNYPDGTSQNTTYDNVSNLIANTNPMGRTINYTYDSLNRLTQVKYPDGSTVNYTYDANGNCLNEIGASASSFYAYDARNRLINETDVINGTSYTTRYTYDNASNILSIIYPDNTTLSYTYDPLERVSSVGGYANFTYTVDNKMNTIKYGNNVTTSYSYDARDRPTRILSAYNGTTLLDLNYTYDGVGNVLSINNEVYSYDWLSRLISATGPWGVFNYSYDPAGNLISTLQNGVNTSFVYGSFNRLTKMGSCNFTYDANGNMLSKTDGTTNRNYTYDYENRLTSVTVNSQLIQSNVYSGDSRRIMANNNGTTTIYVYDGGVIIYDENFTSGQITDYFYVNGLQVAKLAAGTPCYYHEDALGNVRFITSPIVNITFSCNFVPYGQAVNATGTSVFMYTDKPQDLLTGLYYFGARFYDPAISRFISQDSHAGSQIDPLSLNRYIYARDNPEKYVDLNGNMFLGFQLLEPGPPRPSVYIPPPIKSTNPPTSGSTGSGSTGSISSTYSPNPPVKMSAAAYFINVYIKNHLLDFVQGVVFGVLAFLGPGAVIALGGQNYLFEAYCALAGLSIAKIVPSLSKDIASGNTAALGADLVGVAFALFKSLPRILDPFRLITLAIIESAWFAGTGGWGEIADLGIGTATVTLFAIRQYSCFQQEYNKYLTS